MELGNTAPYTYLPRSLLSHRTMDPPSSPVPSTQASPVTWHVALWILLTLAISSMAQPSGRICSAGLLKSYRIYFCSSPILCAADALTTLIRLLWTSQALHVSLTKAARLVLIARHCEKHVGQDIWSRWILFIIGTLPAAAKLCSFSGLPWTQAWGFMFASSYILLEGLFLLSNLGSTHLASSLTEEMGYSTITWELEENRSLRHEIKQLQRRQYLVDVICLILALLIHGAISVWAIEDIWLSVSPSLRVAPTYHNLVRSIGLTITIIADTIFMVTLVLQLFGFNEFLSRWLSLKIIACSFLLWVLLSHTVSVLTPKSAQGNIETIDQLNNAMFIFFIIGGVMYALQKAVLFICLRLPTVSRMLSITRPRHAPVVWTDRSHLDVISEPNTMGDLNAQKLLDEEIEIGVAGFMFFCFNIGLCVLWYAVRYDPKGTINPAWTDIFG